MHYFLGAALCECLLSASWARARKILRWYVCARSTDIPAPGPHQLQPLLSPELSRAVMILIQQRTNKYVIQLPGRPPLRKHGGPQCQLLRLHLDDARSMSPREGSIANRRIRYCAGALPVGRLV